MFADRSRVIASVRCALRHGVRRVHAGRPDPRLRAHAVARVPPATHRGGLSGSALRAHHPRRARRDAVDRRAAVGSRRPSRRRRRSGAAPSRPGTRGCIALGRAGCSRCATRRCCADPASAIPRIYAHDGLEGGVDRALAGCRRQGEHRPRRTTAWARASGAKAWGRRELRDFDRVAGDLVARARLRPGLRRVGGVADAFEQAARCHGLGRAVLRRAGVRAAVSRRNCSMAAAIAAASSAWRRRPSTSMRGRGAASVPAHSARLSSSGDARHPHLRPRRRPGSGLPPRPSSGCATASSLRDRRAAMPPKVYLRRAAGRRLPGDAGQGGGHRDPEVGHLVSGNPRRGLPG